MFRSRARGSRAWFLACSTALAMQVVLPAWAAVDSEEASIATADTVPWTLGSTVRRVIEVAPERRAADAEVAAREGDLKRDTAFPNPTVEGRVDQKLGLDDGAGGTDVTQLSITQPLPLWRLPHQRAQAKANLDAARAARSYGQLLLENEAARAFHQLQLAEAGRRLASKRADAAMRYGEPKSASGMVRYLSALDRTRLSILKESARQELATADGEWREAATQYRRLLSLPETKTPITASLNTLPPLPAIDEIEARLDAHPAMILSQRQIEASRASIGAARASRFADPTLTLLRERDVLGGERQDYWGITLGVELPFWNLNRGAVDTAVANVNRAEAEADARRRDLDAALRASHQRLARLIEQAEHFAEKVLDPSRQFLELTGRSFAAGELGVLALLDANNNYFDAERQHLELVAEAALAAADLRLAAGESLLQEGQP